MEEQNSSGAIAEISQGPSKFDAFMDKNQKLLIIAAIIAVIAVVAAIVFTGLGDLKKQDAGSKLFSAEGEAELNEAINGAPDNVQATGYLLLGKQQLNTDAPKAKETFKNILATFPDSAVAEQAKLLEAVATHRSGEEAAAKRIFEEIANDENAGSTRALANFALAEFAKSDNEIDKAAEYFAAAAEASNGAALKNESTEAKVFVMISPPTVIKTEVKDSEKDKLEPKNPPMTTPGTNVIPLPAGSITPESSTESIAPVTPVPVAPATGTPDTTIPTPVVPTPVDDAPSNP